VTDVLEESLVNRVRLEAEELKRIVQLRKQDGLDFDDAYQLTAALRYELVLVSFDGDFDRTELGRKTPAQCLNI
jgi:uncharacterized protein